MLNDAEANAFYNLLAETETLAKFFGDNYDFGVDPYDPAVEDMYKVICEALQDDTTDELADNEDLELTIVRGLERHITLARRAELYDRLESLRHQADPQDREMIRVAQRALEDMNIHPVLIGMVNRLYHKHLADLLLNKRDRAGAPIRSETLALLKDEAKTALSNEAVDEILRLGEAVLPTIETLMNDEAYNAEILLEIATRIPCYRSARMVAEELLGLEWFLHDLIKMCREKELLPLVSTYVLNELEKKETGFLHRWQVYEFLTAIKEHKVFKYLRRELTARDYWKAEFEKYQPDAEVEFYGAVAEWLVKMEDRRAIPAFIKFLREGQKMGFPQEVRDAIGDVLKQSKWHQEIQNALALLKEGEFIFVKKGDDLMDIVMQKVEKDNKFRAIIGTGQPTIFDLQKRAEAEQTRWNEAYHEDLDGLRPLDVPISRVKIDLLRRMVEEFEKKIAGRPDVFMDEIMQDYEAFQSEWMIKPLQDHGGQIPLALIFKDEEKLATTVALQENFQRYKENTVNSLYLEAADRFEAGDMEGARQRILAVLQLEPAYPFALRLKSKMDG